MFYFRGILGTLMIELSIVERFIVLRDLCISVEIAGKSL